MTKNDEKWEEQYFALRKYIASHGHLPDKKKVENRGLLNWWKYNKRRIKEGKLDDEKMLRLQSLSNMRASSDKPQEQPRLQFAP